MQLDGVDGNERFKETWSLKLETKDNNILKFSSVWERKGSKITLTMSIQLKHNKKSISRSYKQKTKLKKGKACKHEPSNIYFLVWNS